MLGVLALPPIYPTVHEVVGGVAPEPGLAALVTSSLLAIVVVGGTVFLMRGHGSRRLARPWPRVLTEWLLLEQVAHRVVVRPVVLLAQRLALVDDAVLDRGVQSLGRGTVRLSRTTARVDDLLVDGGVLAVVSGVRAAGRFVRRSHTGQLHQYYLQALAVLAAALLVLFLVR